MKPNSTQRNQNNIKSSKQLLHWGQSQYCWLATKPGHKQPGASLSREVPPEVQELCHTLVGIAGQKAVVPLTDDLTLDLIIANNGVLVMPQGLTMKRGEPSNCHGNSAKLWSKSKGKYRFVTGYALIDDDRMWGRHSWLTTKEGKIIETTVPRDLYFGIGADWWAERILQLS